MNRWWRAYEEAVDDPKLQLLQPVAFKTWFNLLCLSSANGGELPKLSVIAFKLRLADDKARHAVAELTALGLFDERDGKFTPHNWNGRQFKSDTDHTAGERARNYRDKKRSVTRDAPVTEPVTPRTQNASVTRDNTEPSLAPESERTEAETEKKEDCRESVPTRYPEDFENGFWKPYPRTPVMSKKEALTAWKRLAPEDREKAVAAVSPYISFLKSKPDHPTVHACRFLSQRRFDGFGAAAQSSQQKIAIPRHGQILGPEFGEKASGRVFVLAETPEWDAWCGYIRGLGKPAPPRYFHEGWAFTTLWPPGYEPQTEAAE